MDMGIRGVGCIIVGNAGINSLATKMSRPFKFDGPNRSKHPLPLVSLVVSTSPSPAECKYNISFQRASPMISQRPYEKKRPAMSEQDNDTKGIVEIIDSTRPEPFATANAQLCVAKAVRTLRGGHVEGYRRRR